MQRGNAVDAVAGRHAEVGHPYRAAGDDGGTLHVVRVVGAFPHVGAEAVVDLFDDLVDAGHQAADEVLAPLLQRFLHHGVVGVGHDGGHHLPGVVPAVAALVQQDAHQLRDGQRRVGVVDLHGDGVGEVLQRAVLVQVVADHILHGGGNQEILLAQPQALALRMVVGGVQHLADGAGHGVALQRLQVLALVEQRHVKAGGLRGPHAQHADALAVLARHEHVVRYRADHVGVHQLHVVVVIVPAVDHFAAEAHVDGAFLALGQPHLAAGQPEVGQLGLPAVHQLLLEDAVLVQDRVASGGVALGGEAVQITGREAPEAAVAQARVRLAVVELFQTDPVALQHLLEGLRQIQVIQVVFQRAAHQKFHGEIVDTLGARLFAPLIEVGAGGGHDVLQDHRNGAVILVVGSRLGGDAEKVEQFIVKQFLCLGFCQVVFHAKPPKRIVKRGFLITLIVYFILLFAEKQPLI